MAYLLREVHIQTLDLRHNLPVFVTEQLLLKALGHVLERILLVVSLDRVLLNQPIEIAFDARLQSIHFLLVDW